MVTYRRYLSTLFAPVDRPDAVDFACGCWFVGPLFRVVFCLLFLFPLLLSPVAVAGGQVEVTGIDGELHANVMALLTIAAEPDATPTRVRHLHHMADGEIARALEPFGYYQPQVTGELSFVGDESWLASYRVEPGPPMVVESLELEISGQAADDPAFSRLRQRLPIGVGDRLDHRSHEAMKGALVALANRRGYFMARMVESRVTIERERSVASIRILFDSGVRGTIGTTLFDSDRFDHDYLLRYAGYQSGEPFDMALVTAYESALRNSGHFSHVEVSPLRDRISLVAAEPARLDVPIDVRLVERNPTHLALGFGYGTDSGPRLSGEWQRRRLNRRGDRFNSSVRLSPDSYRLGAEYLRPGESPQVEQRTFSLAVEEESVDDRRSQRADLGWSERVQRGDWIEERSLHLINESYDIANRQRSSLLLMPGIDWSRLWGEDRLNPRQGASLEFGLRGASSNLLSDHDLLQADLKLRLIEPFGEAWRLLSRVELGAIVGDDIEQLPLNTRYFAGGDRSVRGYGYQKLSPTDSAGRPVGGRYQVLLSLELDRQISGPWSGAIFYDTGNAFDHFGDPLEQSLGFGVRWQSPVGPIRLDLARSISDPERSFRIHLVIGPDL